MPGLAPFDQLRRVVMQNPALMRELTSTQSQSELFELVVSLGREHALPVTIAELEEIIRANRRSWLERWLFQ
ncbi:MAG TPA: hypothetical protein VGL72_21870 [Bryobacteraceae bacterium]